MKKVCFIISGITYSGAEIVLERYIDNSNIIDPYFIVLYKNDSLINLLANKYGKEKVNNLNIKYSKIEYTFLYPILERKVAKGIMNLINDICPEFIYVNNTREGFICAKILECINIPNLVHIHDMKESTKNPYGKLLMKKYLNKYNKRITVSNATKSSWRFNECEYIYNGIDEVLFQSCNKNKQIKTVAFIGALTKRKGADYFIELIPELIKRKLNIIIIFNGYEKSVKRKLNNLLPLYKNNISLYENLKSKEVLKMYKNIDLLIVPSRRDPLPTVIMEAQSNSILTIGNIVDGIPEMINNNELLFNIKNENEILKVIDNLISKSINEIDLLRSELYNNSKQNFILSNSTKKKNKIINDLLMDRRGK